jgi:hypothetical protein
MKARSAGIGGDHTGERGEPEADSCRLRPVQPVRKVLAARAAGVLLVSLMLPNFVWLITVVAMAGGETVSAVPAAVITVGESFVREAWRQTGVNGVIWVTLLAMGIWILLARPARLLAVIRRLERQ